MIRTVLFYNIGRYVCHFNSSCYNSGNSLLVENFEGNEIENRGLFRGRCYNLYIDDLKQSLKSPYYILFTDDANVFSQKYVSLDDATPILNQYIISFIKFRLYANKLKYI